MMPGSGTKSVSLPSPSCGEEAARTRFSAMVLAGGLQPSPLRSALGLPVLSLPIGDGETLLDRWISVIAAVPGCQRIVIVVSVSLDREAINEFLPPRHTPRGRDGVAIPVEVRLDPREFRGPAGIARDFVDALGADLGEALLLVEAACLPPMSLEPLFEAVGESDAGAVGSSAELEPAGVYLIARDAFALIPTIGFHDLKEQTLPMLYARGQRLKVARIVPEVWRLREREGYLSLIQRHARSAGLDSIISPGASVSPTAYVAPGSFLDDRVIVKDGAVIHEAVVMSGAVVEGGAVISRSVVGPQVRIPPRSALRGQVVAAAGRAYPPAANSHLKGPDLSSRRESGVGQSDHREHGRNRRA